MATITQPAPAATPRPLANKLARLRNQIRMWILVDGIGRVLLCLGAVAAVDFLIDWYFVMDRAQRGVMLALMAGVAAWALYRYLIRPLSVRLTDDALCLLVEDQHRDLGESLIAALQFSRTPVDSERVSQSMVRAAIDRGLSGADRVQFSKVLRSDRFGWSLLLLAVMLMLVVAFGVAAATAEPAKIWLNRNLMLGDASWPQDTYFDIEGLQDGRLIIPRGDDWPLVATVTEDSVVVPEIVQLEVRDTTGRRTEPMQADGNGRRFESTLGDVQEPLEFRVFADRSTSPWYKAELVERPEVSEMSLAVTSPPYAGAVTEPLPPGRSPYYVLRGSRLRIEGKSTKPLTRAELIVGEERYARKLTGEHEFAVALDPLQTIAETYQVELVDREQLPQPGRTAPAPLHSREPARFALRYRADRPPEVKARLSGVSRMVVPKARIPLSARATDDFAVTDMRLAHRWRDDASDAEGVQGAVPLAEFLPKELSAAVSFDTDLELEPLKLPEGAGLSLHVEADDNDDVSGPKTGRSSVFLIRIVSEDELRRDLLRREKEQRQEFERLTKEQDDIFTETEAMLAASRDEPALSAEQRKLLMKLKKRQKLLGANTEAIAERLAGIVEEVKNNRLEDEDGPHQRRLGERIVIPMADLAAEQVPAIERPLERARRLESEREGRNEALAEAAGEAKKALVLMRNILLQMEKSEGYQEAINLLYQIEQSQREVKELTEQEKQKLIEELLKKEQEEGGGENRSGGEGESEKE